MMYRKILIAYDGSRPGRKAFDVALDLAARSDAQLLVVNVVRTIDMTSEIEGAGGQAVGYQRDLLAPLESPIRERKVKASFFAFIGRPAGKIMQCAEENEVDLIVVADRKRSKLARFWRGSVYKRVVLHADRQVLVVR